MTGDIPSSYIRAFNPLLTGPQLHFNTDVLLCASTVEAHHGKETEFITQVSPVVEEVIHKYKSLTSVKRPLIQLRHSIIDAQTRIVLKYKLEMKVLADGGFSKDTLVKLGLPVVGNTIIDIDNKSSAWLTLQAGTFLNKYKTYITLLPLLGNPDGVGYDIHKVIKINEKYIDVSNYVQVRSSFSEEEKEVIEKYIIHCEDEQNKSKEQNTHTEESNEKSNMQQGAREGKDKQGSTSEEKDW